MPSAAASIDAIDQGSIRSTSDSIFKERRGYAFAVPRREAPELCIKLVPPKTEGAGKTGCPPHPWSACSKKARGRTTGTSRINRPSLRNGFNGFLRALPGDEFLFATVAPRIDGAVLSPVGPSAPPRDLTPATGARTTRLLRPQQRRSSARRPIAHEKSPCDHLSRADAAASTASRAPRP